MSGKFVLYVNNLGHAPFRGSIILLNFVYEIFLQPQFFLNVIFAFKKNILFFWAAPLFPTIFFKILFIFHLRYRLIFFWEEGPYPNQRYFIFYATQHMFFLYI